MEALLAIGLAGNVVQFVHFTGQLISKAKSIREKGARSSILDLRALADSLTKQTDMISKSLQSSPPVSEEDRFLLELSTECSSMGTEFLADLDGLLGNPPSSNPIHNAAATFKFALLRPKLDDFAMKLDKLRNALVLGSILAFRASANVNLQDVLVHLQQLEQGNQDQNVSCAEILKIVKSITDFHGHAVPKLELIHEHVQGCLKQLSSLKDDMSESREKQILRWLDFRPMTWRFEEVHLAHQNTFSWIFKGHPRESARNWDDFAAHLSQPEVTLPYFINGKAGSGKSTLMKFIVGHPETKRLLAQWAGDAELLVVKFFFWNLGTDLQKSTLGMLRALLHNILARYPELIPGVFSGMYQSWAESDRSGDAKEGREPHLIEVKSAFERLIHKSASFLKVCIFIDGIDEFEGDHRDLSEFLRALASRHIKIVVSARPLPICLSIFDGCPSLELQRLTEPDMKLFIEETLIAHRPMIALSKQFPEETSELVNELKEKAAGVFLWVRLVVRLLKDGIEAGDDVTELQRKLRSLPSGLKDLYIRMFSGMDLEYRTQAAEIFQLLHAWKQRVPNRPLNTITLWFALKRPSEASSQPIGLLDKETFNWICKKTEARIRSRCCGLLDIYSNAPVPKADLSPASNTHFHESAVDYHHRTVAEFLVSDNNWDDICKMTRDSNFDASVSLASACISTIKTSKLDGRRIILDNINALVDLCRTAQAFAEDRTLVSYIDLLDTTMTRIYNRYAPHIRQHWSTDLYLKDIPDLRSENKYRPLCRSAGILSFAAQMGISRYLIRNDYPHSSQQDKTATVLFALQSWRMVGLRRTIALHNRIEVLLHVLDGPALLAFDCLAWRFVVNHVCPHLNSYPNPEPNVQGNADTDDESDGMLTGKPMPRSPMVRSKKCNPLRTYPLFTKTYRADYAALLAMCLNTTDEPQKLVPDLPKNLDLWDMAFALSNYKDAVLENLGRELERTLGDMRDRLANSNKSSPGTIQDQDLTPKNKVCYQNARSDQRPVIPVEEIPLFPNNQQCHLHPTNPGFTTPQLPFLLPLL